jgi:hypothetical protein
MSVPECQRNTASIVRPKPAAMFMNRCAFWGIGVIEGWGHQGVDLGPHYRQSYG